MNPVLEKLDSLPIELRAIIEGDEVIEIIDSICDEVDIPYSWRGELIRATIKVLSGLLRPNEFVPFIMDEYYLDEDEALSLASKINEKIFSAVKPQLASLYNIEDKQIAKKLQVPKKPKTYQSTISTPQKIDQSSYGFAYEAPKVQDLMPKNVPNINIVHPSILNQSKISNTLSEDTVPPPPVHNLNMVQNTANIGDLNAVPQSPSKNISSFNPQTTQPKPAESTLTNKLGGLRFDNYREPV